MVSIVMNGVTLVCMMRTLKGFITEKREQLGWTQTELARRAGVPRTTVNRVEQGTTKLPEADVRRKLAGALGVRHVDLLVAAGELSPNEIDFAEDPRSDAVRRLQPLIDQINWNEGMYQAAESFISLWRDAQRGAFEAPVMLTEIDSTEGIRVTEFDDDKGE
jgi:transcriptional regulator with XRE-family HTH domain